MALSIRQPWAWAVIHAGKDIENRDWHTRYRGPVCIHASKGCTREEHHWAATTITRICDREVPALSAMDRGGIIGVAEIVDCVQRSSSPWFFGSYGFVLAKARPVSFFPCKGSLGFFKWEATP